MSRIVTEYKLSEWNAFAYYNPYEDMYKLPPYEVADGMQHVAHVMYRSKSRTGQGLERSFDIYKVKNISEEHDKITTRTKIIKPQSGLEDVDALNAIRYEFISELSEKERQELTDSIRSDIRRYTEGVPAKNPVPSTTIITPRIVPKTLIVRVTPETLLTDGKQEFIPYCSLDTNLDFSRGCVAEFLPGPNAGNDGTYFYDFWHDLSSGCEYCYALRQHQFFPKSILKLNGDQLREELLQWFHGMKADERAKVLRLGKQTEAGSIYTEPLLEETLDVATSVGTKVVMPTKFLRYTDSIAKRFRENIDSDGKKGTILFSIFSDEVEHGPKIQGFDNNFRMETARQYKEAGVNVGFFLMYDPVPDPREAPHLKETMRVYEFAVKHNIQPQMLPIHLPSKKVAAKVMGGKSWNELKHPEGQHTLDGLVTTGGYEKLGNSNLYAASVNPFWEELVGDNKGFVRMCHHNSKNTWCGDCLMSPGCVGPTQHVDINYENKKPNGVFLGKKPKVDDKNQEKMEFPEIIPVEIQLPKLLNAPKENSPSDKPTDTPNTSKE